MNESNKNFIKSYLVSRHFLLVFVVIIALSSLLYMKGVFDTKSSDSHRIVRYDPALAGSFNKGPLVLGASTETSDEPVDLVIGDDGELVPIGDIGKVLGESSRVAEAVNFRGSLVPTTAQNVRDYLAGIEEVESQYVQPNALETALSNNNAAELLKARNRFQLLVDELHKMAIPDATLAYHTLKLQQYAAAMTILEHFDNLDAHSELVANALTAFMQTEQDQATELLNLQSNYHE